MYRLLKLICLSVIVWTNMAAFSMADVCPDGLKMLNHAVKTPPDEMTKEYVKMALGLCKEKTDIYHRVAKYYKHWYKAESNSDKQAAYWELARQYLVKAQATGNTKQSKGMTLELAKLDDNRSFNVAKFRALRPAKVGAIGSGLEMQVNFDINSVIVSRGEQHDLGQLGKALEKENSIHISLEGHTDKSGELEYNEILSRKRALSVKNYLVKNFNIAPYRVRVTGHGFKHPLNRERPYDPKNRRVEVIKLSR